MIHFIALNMDVHKKRYFKGDILCPSSQDVISIYGVSRMSQLRIAPDNVLQLV